MKLSKLKYLLFAALVLITFAGYAQQDPLFTQYMNNPGLINPAYTGSKGITNINGIFRKQWLGQDWSPTTTSLSASTPYWKYDVGLGLSLVDDKIGPMHQTGLYFDYAKFFYFQKGRNLSLGLKAGFNYYDVNLLNLSMYEYDPYLAIEPHNSALLPNFGVGAYYFTPKFFAGFSVPKLLRNGIKDKDKVIVLGREERHYFITAGCLINVQEPVFRIKASAMTRVVNGSPASLELSATAIIYDRLWVGLNYRFGDAIAAHARFQVTDLFQIGYSYDLNNSRLKGYNTGSHEIFINYDFSLKGQKILSPRYF